VSAGEEVRRLLADVVGDPTAATLPADTPLLAGGLGLDSVAVVRLLGAIRDRLGVDVADEDLDLESLATVGTLAGFVAARIDRDPTQTR
jgi:acyl carrier protein